jgi:hypothetical protein
VNPDSHRKARLTSRCHLVRCHLVRCHLVRCHRRGRYRDVRETTTALSGTNLHVVMGQLSGTGTTDWPFYVAVN